LAKECAVSRIASLLVGFGGLLVGAALAWWLAPAVAQQNMAVPTRVGLIDLEYVLKNYQKFNRLADELNAEAKRKEEEIRALQDQLRGLIKQQQAQKPDSPLYAQLQAEATKKRAELEATVANAQRDFARRQANLYHSTYQEVEYVVSQFAQARGLTLVIRSSRDTEVSANDPQAVFREISRPVLYSHPSLDISDQILAILNSGNYSATPSSPAPRATLTPTAQEPELRPRR
jgi:Skp family chaperone for outer membrane proteins